METLIQVKQKKKVIKWDENSSFYCVQTSDKKIEEFLHD